MLECVIAAPPALPIERYVRSEEDSVERVVQAILAGKSRLAGKGERRRDSRVPFPYLVRLSPLADDGVSPGEESIVVVGKHLSAGGLDFYHREPIPHRRMIAKIEGHGGSVHTLLLELSWCRFNKQGWYENGGRFLKLVPAPANRELPL